METPKYLRLLPPETTSLLSRLEFLARGKVEGFITGRHRSPHKGFSVEFAEHRQYAAGDDLRNLDWRVWGRSDRYYIKEYTEETNLRATILVDASGSMAYTGKQAAQVDGRPLSKFEYAQYLASALTYLLIQQQDAVGLVTFDTHIRKYVPAKSRPSQVRLVLDELVATNPGGETGVAEIFHDIAERVHRRGVIIIISDLFDDPEEINKALRHFGYRKHEVIVFHVMAEEELTFPFSRFTHFRNLEMLTHRLQVDPKAVKADYLEKVKTFIKTVETGCGQMQADYVPMTTKQSFDTALANFLTMRKGKR
ncbi:MAG: DUF58 domain-containing protein [Kiritimatiellia bacterium]|jgi:uncharacterized protein (DUF58 family)|nr:DUF58 domain-containing protein [Kiritimatiellia bacterium]